MVIRVGIIKTTGSITISVESGLDYHGKKLFSIQRLLDNHGSICLLPDNQLNNLDAAFADLVNEVITLFVIIGWIRMGFD